MNKNKVIPIILFVVYIILLVNILILKLLPVVTVGKMMLNFGGTQEGLSNLIPFKTIIQYISGKNGFLIPMINIVGNIIALVPAGFLIPFIYNKMNWRKIISLAITLGLIIETIQLILHIGIFDKDDVILNALGVVIGYWNYNLYKSFSKSLQVYIATFVSVIVGAIMLLLVLSFYKKNLLPFGLTNKESVDKLMPILNTNVQGENCCDLCNGTGGTGKIMSVCDNSIIIKRKDGFVQKIKISSTTIIKNSKGLSNISSIKIGDHVTLIIDESETASIVLICGK